MGSANEPLFEVPRYNVNERPKILPHQEVPKASTFHPRGEFSHRGLQLRFVPQKQFWMTQPDKDGFVPPELSCAWSDQETWRRAVDVYLNKQEKLK